MNTMATARKSQDASTTSTTAAAAGTNIMLRCNHRYRLAIKIVVLLLLVQVLYLVVYKRFENYVFSQNPTLDIRDKNNNMPSRSHVPVVADIQKPPINMKLPFTINSNISETILVSKSHRTTLLPTHKNISMSLQQSENITISVTVNSSDIVANRTNLTLSTTISPAVIRHRNIMANVSRLFDSSWSRKINRTYVDEFRNQLVALNTHKMFILSQQNVKQGEALHFSHNKDRNQLISQELYKSFPQVCPFLNQSFERCSVVGSGGILNNSSCGKDIDKAEYIFRCNAPPVAGFEVDAGSRTNMTTLNPSTAWQRYHGLKSSSDKTTFLRTMQAQKADILFPLFGTKSGYSVARQITRMMKLAKNPSLKPLILHPKHFSAVQNFWEKRGFDKRMSTGFYLTSVAIALCKETYLYGFWPFPTDLDGKEVPYHYYDSLLLTGVAHDFPLEFQVLLQLHRDRVLNLVINPCEPKEGS